MSVEVNWNHLKTSFFSFSSSLNDLITKFENELSQDSGAPTSGASTSAADANAATAAKFPMFNQHQPQQQLKQQQMQQIPNVMDQNQSCDGANTGFDRNCNTPSQYPAGQPHTQSLQMNSFAVSDSTIQDTKNDYY